MSRRDLRIPYSGLPVLIRGYGSIRNIYGSGKPAKKNCNILVVREEGRNRYQGLQNVTDTVIIQEFLRILQYRKKILKRRKK
jgi:hypothetical protein